MSIYYFSDHNRFINGGIDHQSKGKILIINIIRSLYIPYCSQQIFSAFFVCECTMYYVET